MADQPSCLHCYRTSLFHTGALWMCPRCGLMITKHALAAETDGTRLATGTEQADGFNEQTSD